MCEWLLSDQDRLTLMVHVEMPSHKMTLKQRHYNQVNCHIFLITKVMLWCFYLAHQEASTWWSAYWLDGRSRGPGFKSCWRQNSTYYCTALVYTAPFIITLPLTLVQLIGYPINWLIIPAKMIIITDLLIIDYLISLYVTLLYLPLVFRHLNSLPYFI